jgi:acyl carrier protein
MELEKIQKIIVEVLNVDSSEIKPETTFVEDLGADSLDLFQIVQGIEEEFEIQIDAAEVENIKTVQDAIDQLRKSGYSREEI